MARHPRQLTGDGDPAVAAATAANGRERRGGSDQATVRSLNRGVVLDAIKRGGPISRAQVAKTTRLTKPTVSAIVDELTSEGLLTEIGVGPASPSGGRRPVLYTFNAASYFLLGVHLGVETTVVALADGAGTQLARVEEATPSDPKQALRSAIAHGHALMDGDPALLRAVGVTVTGLVDHRRGVCLLAPNLGWRDVDVPAILAPRTDAAVAVHNVAQAVLAAEHLEGAVQDYADVVLLYEDRGVGSAILSDGHLFHGARGIAGEIGHCKIAGSRRRCGCGALGCLETEVSEPAILRRARERSGGRLRPRTLKALRDHADPQVGALLHEVGRELGRATAILANVVNPQAVVVAGGFLDGGERLLAGLAEALAEDALPEAAAGVAVMPSALGHDGPIRGAVLLARYAAERAGDPLFGAIGPSTSLRG